MVLNKYKVINHKWQDNLQRIKWKSRIHSGKFGFNRNVITYKWYESTLYKIHMSSVLFSSLCLFTHFCDRYTILVFYTYFIYDDRESTHLLLNVIYIFCCVLVYFFHAILIIVVMMPGFFNSSILLYNICSFFFSLY